MCWREKVAELNAPQPCKPSWINEHVLELWARTQREFESAPSEEGTPRSARAFIIGGEGSTSAPPQSANVAPGCATDMP